MLPNGQFRFVFTASDFEKSKAFYLNAIGAGIDHEWDFGPADRGICLTAGAGMIEIFPTAPGELYLQPQGVSMLIEVADVDAAYEHAVQAGAEVVVPTADYPWGQRIARFKDPDGIVVSLFTPIKA